MVSKAITITLIVKFNLHNCIKNYKGKFET
jgi:hypothetical protein